MSSTPTAPEPDPTKTHDVATGEAAIVVTFDHADRTDSKAFRDAKNTAHKILALPGYKPFFVGDGGVQMHHGGSLWVLGDTGWRMFLNEAGIEWSMQFCCEPANVDRLRENALALINAFPLTLPGLIDLGYHDAEMILTAPITDAAGIAVYTDSLFNSCVPLPQKVHTGRASEGVLSAHFHPRPVADAEFLKWADLQIVHVVGSGKVVAVPVAPRGSGDGRVEIVHADHGTPQHDALMAKQSAGQRHILPETDPLAQATFAKQAA